MSVGFAWMLASKVNSVCMLVSYVFALVSNVSCVCLLSCVCDVCVDGGLERVDCIGYCLWL